MGNTQNTLPRPDLDQLYCINEDGSRRTIHTADVKGRYQARKRTIWAILIGVYVAVPWLKVDGRPAILIDLMERDFFLFGMTFNARDFWLAFFVVSGIGFTLFVVSALFGRLWCGYGCPQTVFLEGVFRRIERWIEGGAGRRKQLEQSGWNAAKIAKRSAKWAIYLVISLLLSHTMLGYFMPIEEVVAATTNSPAANPTAFAFVLIFTAIIYLNFVWFREQMCIVICPYGRLQGVLYDADTINVGYDEKRGEPRGKYTAEVRGDCIDCYCCVAVCPTGIDIRNGTQLECIGCANCIDACDEVMVKLGQPTGLVRYDSQRGFESGSRRFVRPRMFMCAALLIAGLTVFSFAALSREPYEARVVRQQGSAFTVQDGSVRNGFFLHLTNKEPDPCEFVIEPIARDGVEFVLPVARVELGRLANQRLPFFVEVERARFARGMRLGLHVRCQLGDRVIEIPIVGPDTDRQ